MNDAAAEASRRYRGWRIVAVCFIVAVFSWGLGFYGQGVFLAELIRAHGWSTSFVSIAFTTYYLASAVMVAFVGDAIARIGPRKVVLTGAVAFAVSTAALGALDRPWQLFAALLVMSVGWGAMSVGAISAIVSLWFSARRGLAIAIALTGASAGGVLVVPPLQALVHAVGFSQGALIAAGITVAILAPLAFLIDEPPSRAAIAETRAPQWSRAKAARSPLFWSATAPFMIVFTTQVAFLVHEIAIFTPRLGPAGASYAVALTTGVAIAGRLVLGAVIDRLDARTATAVSVASQAAAMVLAAWGDSALPLYFAAAVYGFSVGNVVILPALVFQREFEAASFTTLVAFQSALCQFSSAFGAGALGVLRDWTGGYATPLLLCAMLNLAAGGLVAFWRPRLG